jgi:predicted enzyme related to lactoylglutathione lyase
MNVASYEEERESATRPATPISISFELLVIPVSDAGRSKSFYQSLGWSCDIDFNSGDGYRVVQFTPPGSGSSIIFGSGVSAAVPGSFQGMHLIVADIRAARKDLLERGIRVSEVFHDRGGIFHRVDTQFLAVGPNPEGKSYASYATFSDPDGNAWVLQEVTRRLPPRNEAEEAHFTRELMAEVHRELSHT